jgi:hypothetical protein
VPREVDGNVSQNFALGFWMLGQSRVWRRSGGVP